MAAFTSTSSGSRPGNRPALRAAPSGKPIRQASATAAPDTSSDRPTISIKSAFSVKTSSRAARNAAVKSCIGPFLLDVSPSICRTLFLCQHGWRQVGGVSRHMRGWASKRPCDFARYPVTSRDLLGATGDSSRQRGVNRLGGRVPLSRKVERTARTCYLMIISRAIPARHFRRTSFCLNVLPRWTPPHRIVPR